MAIQINLSDDKRFDDVVHNAAPSSEGLDLVTKRNATIGGLPSVALGFEASVDGKIVRVQQVVTLRELVTAVRGAVVHHSTFDPAWQNADVPHL